MAEGRWCVAFPFDRSLLAPSPLELHQRSLLDLEDIGALLQGDAVSVSFPQLPGLRDRVPQTPIEDLLSEAMGRRGVRARPQVKVGPYRVDFLIEQDGRRIAVEADGRDYHLPDRDRQRDEQLGRLGIDAVLRFTGSEIWRDADACAERVASFLAAHPSRPRGVPIDKDLDPSQAAAVSHPSGAARIL